MDGKTIAVLLADGFEEIEALTVVDVLRRAGFAVLATGIDGEPWAHGAHDVLVKVDAFISELPVDSLAMVVLPGGMPGSVNLAESTHVGELVRSVRSRGGLVGAICAAPIALQAAGILPGRRYTCYPGFEQKIADGSYTGATVECDDRIITSRGVGTALEFALALVEALGAPDKARELRRGILAPDWD